MIIIIIFSRATMSIFLKDHVTMKTGAMMNKYNLNTIYIKIENTQH